MIPDNTSLPVVGTRDRRVHDDERVEALAASVRQLRVDLNDALDLLAELDVKVRRLVVAERRRN